MGCRDRRGPLERLAEMDPPDPRGKKDEWENSEKWEKKDTEETSDFKELQDRLEFQVIQVLPGQWDQLACRAVMGQMDSPGAPAGPGL